jgi:hypothetical protein
MSRVARILVAALVTVVATGRSAGALELTGTWTGTTKCTSFYQGAKVVFGDAPTVQITQDGRTIGVRADFGQGNISFYAGRTHPAVKKPDEKGEIALVACGTDDVLGNDPDFDELGRFTAVTKLAKIKATLKGVSFFSDPGVALPEAGTCKWKLTRTDTVNMHIPTSCTPAN